MFSIQVDRRANKSTLVKSIQIAPVFKMTEWNRVGLMRWPAIKAQGTLTLALQPSNGETFSIGSKTYTFLSTLANTDGAIQIGASLAQTQKNVVAAINLTGVPGSQYASATSLNADVIAADPVGNNIILCAKVGGTAGNSIATTETMLGAGNQFDAATLGTTRAGAAESDANSMLVPHYHGGFNTNTAQQYNSQNMYYLGYTDYDNDRVIGNNYDIERDFPTEFYNLLAGAIKKMWWPNHLERRIKTVKTIGLYTKLRSLETQTLNAPFNSNTNNAVFKSFELDANRFIVFYRQQAGTTGIYAVVGQANTDGTVAWGAPLLMCTRDMYNENFDAVLINTDKVLIAIDAPGSPFNINTAVVTISGTALTLNSMVQVAAIQSSFKRLVKIGTDKAILSYENSNVSLVCVSVSGTVPSYGSIATIASSSKGILAPNGTDKAQIAYINSSAWWSAVVTVAGTTITVQAGVQIAFNGSYGFRQSELYPITTDKFLFYTDWASVGYPSRDRFKFGLITVSTTTTALAKSYYTPISNDGNFAFSGQLYFKAVDASSFYIYAYNNSYGLRGAKMTLSGTAINFPKLMPRGLGSPENMGESPMYTRQEFDNLGQVGDPLNVNGLFLMVASDQYANGKMTIFSDKPFSFDLYIGDDLLGTYTKTLLGLIEPMSINATVNKEEFGIKIKSNDAVDRTVFLDHAFMLID